MTHGIRELNTTETDSVSGATSVEEAMALMAKWNKAITEAGENAYMFGYGHSPKPNTGGSCSGQY
ncbi:hypothetical protein [Nitrobacter sp. JJSN]|jgi:hypothetical protein|uniref:hypothetical protein n=1 Tax=Nitrobacter sp. JJSN TaxID=3453033 RepID=UPI003F758065